jgi:hypothetical protein
VVAGFWVARQARVVVQYDRSDADVTVKSMHTIIYIQATPFN